jgi:hypothetical protein
MLRCKLVPTQLNLIRLVGITPEDGLSDIIYNKEKLVQVEG